MSRRGRSFSCIRTQGGLLPQDQLERVAALDKSVEGLDPESYGEVRPLREAAAEAWSRLQARWASLKEAVEGLEPDDAGVRLTRDRFLLPLFRELAYGNLPSARLQDDEGKTYPLSHAWDSRVPVHLLGWNVGLDERRKGTAGAATASPHGLLQDFLNRSEKHLWGFVSNGRQLRLLRDHQSLARLAFVEFDLEAIFDDEQFSEFVVLWLTCHQTRTRFEDQPRECLLETWHEQARNEGVRALDKLREGVEAAIKTLGSGFLAHPGNAELHEALRSGTLDPQQYYRELLRIAYRLIFLFVAEDRGLLLVPDDQAKAGSRELYERWYSTRRLRELALTRRGGPHPDLWRSLRFVMGKLDQGCEELALPALGSFLWRDSSVPWAPTADLANEDLLAAIRKLCEVDEAGDRRVVSWQNVGAEELGSVYESLLELRPRLDRDTAAFEFVTAAGHERKTTGSYYTPTSLVECLLDTALDPVVDERLKGKRGEEAEAALLDIKVCDPACGSGHFLVAAARRLARRLAQERSGDDEPSPSQHLRAMRDVVSHCLFGADLNEMAIELAKVSLWLEAIEPGKPLSFLESHFACGNSLLGATPALMEKGIPDEAFKPIEGDDRKIASELRRANKKERPGQQSLIGMVAAEKPAHDWAPVERRLERLEEEPEETAAAVAKKEDAWRELRESAAWRRSEFLADAWCAAFVWPKNTAEDARFAITESEWRALVEGKEPAGGQLGRVHDLKEAYRFVHWHVEFPQVFRPRKPAEEAENPTAGWDGGFEVVLGNPPWERIKLQEKEWFAERAPEIAEARTAAARRKMILELEASEPLVWKQWLAAKRQSAGESHLVRHSSLYPLCGVGDVNTYAVFAELNRRLSAPGGRVGCIVPTGIATDDTTKQFFQQVVDQSELVSLLSFENEEHLFVGVHNAFKFSLLTLRSRLDYDFPAEFVCFIRRPEQLRHEELRYSLTAADIRRLNPNTRTCPTFRTRRDAEIVKGVYERNPILLQESVPPGDPWGLQLGTMLHMSGDSDLFEQRDALLAQGFELVGGRLVSGEALRLPLYEAKMIHSLDHRFGTYEGQTQAQANKGFLPRLSDAEHLDPLLLPESQFWVDPCRASERARTQMERPWMLSWRRHARSVDERTLIPAVIPRAAAGDSLVLVTVTGGAPDAFLAAVSSFGFDYVMRQKHGGSNTSFYVLRQLPAPKPEAVTSARALWGSSWFERGRARVLELTYTAWDLKAWACDLGWDGPPFRWDPERRFLLRCELDAAFFHLYGIERDDVDYIMETFPIVKKKDEKAHGVYRTKDTILSIYDAMSEATRTGTPYRTLLDPPPADPSLCHPPRDAAP